MVEHAEGFADRLPREGSPADSARVERAYMPELTRMAETREMDGAMRCGGKSVAKLLLSRADAVQ